MTAKVREIVEIDDLKVAEEGSFYTILGAGGDLSEWVDGYERELVDAAIGKPARWYRTTGGAINDYVGSRNVNPFNADLTVLLFPLDGLDIRLLAIFKIQWEDRWFDDLVANMRSDVYVIDDDAEEE